MNSKVGTSIAVLFGAAVIACPWFLGGNIPPVRTIALAIVFVSAVGCCFVPSLAGTPTSLGLTLKLTLLLGLGWAVAQTLPLFDGEAISQYIPATRSRICELSLGIGAFFVASCVYRNQKVLPWFLGAIAFNGVLITFFGLAQSVSDTDRLFWFYELIWGGEPFGPFVNGNNCGGYLLLCFAAANFFLARRVFRAMKPNQNDGNYDAFNFQEKKKSLGSEITNSLGRAFAELETQQLYILAAVGVIAAGVLATTSRGAAVALVIALMIGWGLLFRRNLVFGLFSLLAGGAGIGILVWTQQSGAIVSSLETLADVEHTSGHRLVHWKDAWAYTLDSQPLGSGLGTYSIMYPTYQTTWHFNRWFKHAENQYLETLAELGIPGLIVLLVAIAAMVIASLKLLSFPDSTSRAVGLMGLIAILSQIVAGSFDFGLYQPANTLLMAGLVGVVFGQLNWGWSARHVGDDVRPRGKVALAWCGMLAIAATTGWASYEYSGVDARCAVRRFNERFDPQRDRDQIKTYQRLGEYAVSLRPDDSEAHYHLAMNYISQYRVAASDAMIDEISQTRQRLQSAVARGSETSDGSADDATTAADAQKSAMLLQMLPQDFDFDSAWESSSLLMLDRLAWASHREGPQHINDLRNTVPVQDYLTHAWDHLSEAETQCDRFWLTPARMASLCMLMGHGEEQERYLEQAIARCPMNSKLMFLIGLAKLNAGKTESACEYWNKCLHLTRKYDETIINLCRTDVGIKPFFELVLPTDPYFRIRVAKRFFGSEQDLLIKKLLMSHSKSKVDEHDLPDAERQFVLGEMERLSQNNAVAIIHFQRALKLKNHRTDWRMQYARTLIESSKYDEAIAELKVCELFQGNHHIVCHRLTQRAKRLRMNEFKENNGLKFGRNQ